jgi:hypothetical protein
VKFYYVHDGETAPYCTTLAEAKRAARTAAETSYWDVKVSQVEVSTDRENILRLCNDAGGTHVTLKEEAYVAKAKRKKEG